MLGEQIIIQFLEKSPTNVRTNKIIKFLKKRESFRHQKTNVRTTKKLFIFF